jgi:hypothetical protein
VVTSGHMLNSDEQRSIVTEALKGSDLMLSGIEIDKHGALIVSAEDTYGAIDFEIKPGNYETKEKLEESFGRHKTSRDAAIASWEFLKSLLREMMGYIDGERDETGKMGWLPKQLARRFEDEHQLRLPMLRSFAADPKSVSIEDLRREVEGLPHSWQSGELNEHRVLRGHDA